MSNSRNFGFVDYDYPDLSPVVLPEEPKNVPDGYVAVQGYDYFGFPEWVCVPAPKPVIYENFLEPLD